MTGSAPATGLVSVSGNFPQPTAAQAALGAVSGLVRNPSSASLTGALADGAMSVGPSQGSQGGIPCVPSAYVAGTAYSAGQCFTTTAGGQTVTVTVSSTTGDASGTGTASSQFLAGTPDIAVWNGSTVQVWAAANAGATTAYAGQPVTLADSTATGGPTAAQKAYMGAYYQW